jgi:hypothetical protein
MSVDSWDSPEIKKIVYFVIFVYVVFFVSFVFAAIFGKDFFKEKTEIPQVNHEQSALCILRK